MPPGPRKIVMGYHAMDWVRFFDENLIGYVTRGPNTAKNNISIKCPFCGDEDPSQHMGVSLVSENWGCLRDATHRGKGPKWLVRAILNCSFTQAGLIVSQYSHSDPDDLESAIQMLKEDEIEVETKEETVCRFPNYFHSIKPRGSTKKFFDYLTARNFDAKKVVKNYNLKCSMLGKYKDRIIIPIYVNGELLGWTSRAIGTPKIAPRYLASSDKVKATVWNYDELKKGGKRLFIVEGPFDALAIDSFAKYYLASFMPVPPVVKATCVFGTEVTIAQIILLRNIMKGFEETYVLFDKGAEGPAGELASWLKCLEVTLPDGIDDPGELPNEYLSQMVCPGFSGRYVVTTQSMFRRYFSQSRFK